MQMIQPALHVRDPISNLTADAEAGRSAPRSTQIVDRLSMDTEVIGKLTCRKHWLQAQPGKLFSVHAR
ncbi:hypothetical protein SAMN04489810_1321 [Microbacterium pygmaeum]|uniref:Uncharacterized protein n=1 Tax=Microbacterium pygmaeum TaxID=370764 RepID=A0A1G7X811_9MICO|nr:hypothetical protein SAMN04489810_1321 [Microbacterium pygmaeum]